MNYPEFTRPKTYEYGMIISDTIHTCLGLYQVVSYPLKLIYRAKHCHDVGTVPAVDIKRVVLLMKYF